MADRCRHFSPEGILWERQKGVLTTEVEIINAGLLVLFGHGATLRGGAPAWSREPGGSTGIAAERTLRRDSKQTQFGGVR